MWAKVTAITHIQESSDITHSRVTGIEWIIGLKNADKGADIFIVANTFEANLASSFPSIADM